MKYSDQKIGSASIYIHIYHIYPIHILYTLRWWFHLGSAYLHINQSIGSVLHRKQFWAKELFLPALCRKPYHGTSHVTSKDLGSMYKIVWQSITKKGELPSQTQISWKSMSANVIGYNLVGMTKSQELRLGRQSYTCHVDLTGGCAAPNGHFLIP